MATKEKPTEEQTKSQITEEHPPEVKMPQEQKEQPPERQIDRSKRDRSNSVECLEDEISKKAKLATRTDDSHTPNNNPIPPAVIPESSASESTNHPEIETMPFDKLLETYRINQSKLFKINHHLQFLRESLKKYTIPKGLQINKEYQVIDETEDFRKAIRNILMNAEIDTTTAIIEHYEDLEVIIKHNTEALMKRIKELTPTIQNAEKRIESIDQPIETMHEKLTEKRDKKMKELQTHIQRTEKYVNKRNEPRKLKRPDTRKQPRYQHSYQEQYSRYPSQPKQQLPQQQSKTKTYAAAVTMKPNTDQQISSPTNHQPNTDLQQAKPDKNLIELITNIVQNVLSQMLPATADLRTLLAK
ncbi:uncharacterized protein [Dysidea avara]|uniref:uncharacterized protein n=1 Tax=Dysidea avara TaxID=196820 RepID=UPI00332DEA82